MVSIMTIDVSNDVEILVPSTLRYDRLYKVEGKAVSDGFSDKITGSLGRSLALFGGSLQVNVKKGVSELSFSIPNGVCFLRVQEMVDMFIKEQAGHSLSLNLTVTEVV
jgi:hypothetical protein